MDYDFAQNLDPGPQTLASSHRFLKILLPMTLGLVGKMGGFEAVPGLGVDTCLCLFGLLLLFATVLLLLLLSGSPKLFRFGLPGQFMSMNGSLIGTFEL